MPEHDLEMHETSREAFDSYMFALRWKESAEDQQDWQHASSHLEDVRAILREVNHDMRNNCPACRHDEIVRAQLRAISMGL